MNTLEFVGGKKMNKIPASIEVAPKQAFESADLPGLFPKGARVYITDVGTDPTEMLVKAARRIQRLRFRAHQTVTHIRRHDIRQAIAWRAETAAARHL